MECVSREPLQSLSARNGLFQRSLILPLCVSARALICLLSLLHPTFSLFSFVPSVLTPLTTAYYYCSESAIIVQPSAHFDLHLQPTPLNQSYNRRCLCVSLGHVVPNTRPTPGAINIVDTLSADATQRVFPSLLPISVWMKHF